MLSKIGIRCLDDGKEVPLSAAERFIPPGTNPIELHSIEEILATCMIKDLDSGKEATLDEVDKVGPTALAAREAFVSPTRSRVCLQLGCCSVSSIEHILDTSLFLDGLPVVVEITHRLPVAITHARLRAHATAWQVVPKAVSPLALRTVDEALATMVIKDLDTGVAMTMDMASGLMVPVDFAPVTEKSKELVRSSQSHCQTHPMQCHHTHKHAHTHTFSLNFSCRSRHLALQTRFFLVSSSLPCPFLDVRRVSLQTIGIMLRFLRVSKTATRHAPQVQSSTPPAPRRRRSSIGNALAGLTRSSSSRRKKADKKKQAVGGRMQGGPNAGPRPASLPASRGRPTATSLSPPPASAGRPRSSTGSSPRSRNDSNRSRGRGDGGRSGTSSPNGGVLAGGGRGGRTPSPGRGGGAPGRAAAAGGRGRGGRGGRGASAAAAAPGRGRGGRAAPIDPAAVPKFKKSEGGRRKPEVLDFDD